MYLSSLSISFKHYCSYYWELSFTLNCPYFIGWIINYLPSEMYINRHNLQLLVLIPSTMYLDEDSLQDMVLEGYSACLWVSLSQVDVRSWLFLMFLDKPLFMYIPFWREKNQNHLPWFTLRGYSFPFLQWTFDCIFYRQCRAWLWRVLFRWQIPFW